MKQLVAIGRITKGGSPKIETPYTPFKTQADTINNQSRVLVNESSIITSTSEISPKKEINCEEIQSQEISKQMHREIEVPDFMKEYSRQKRLQSSQNATAPTASNIIAFPKMKVETSNEASNSSLLEKGITLLKKALF